MNDDDFNPVEDVTERIIGCAIAVHREYGPGLLESIYQECLTIELKSAGLFVENGRSVHLTYKGHPLESRFRLDMVVEGCVIVELKAVERIAPLHLAQVITYLKLTNCPAGLLLNFNTASLRTGLRRLTHPDLYVRKVVTRNPDDPKRPADSSSDAAGQGRRFKIIDP